MKQKITERKGITLIALVITIIVLLILAGVTIAMLTGDNGILTQANNAKTANTQGGEKEQIQLAWQAVLAEKIKNNEERTINVDELKGQLEYDEAKVEEVVSEGENLKVTFESGNVYTVTQDGKVTLDGEEEPTPPTGGGSAGEIEGTKYGKPVTNYEVNGVTGWEIFYSDDKNIYLIADDYIHKSICPNSATQSIYDNGNGYKLSMDNVIKDYSNAVVVTVITESVFCKHRKWFGYAVTKELSMPINAVLLSIPILKLSPRSSVCITH